MNYLWKNGNRSVRTSIGKLYLLKLHGVGAHVGATIGVCVDVLGVLNVLVGVPVGVPVRVLDVPVGVLVGVLGGHGGAIVGVLCVSCACTCACIVCTGSTHLYLYLDGITLLSAKMNLREGNVLTPVCLFTGRGGFPACITSHMTNIQRASIRDISIQGSLPNLPRTRKVGGTHPTGMLSCCCLLVLSSSGAFVCVRCICSCTSYTYGRINGVINLLMGVSF